MSDFVPRQLASRDKVNGAPYFIYIYIYILSQFIKIVRYLALWFPPIVRRPLGGKQWRPFSNNNQLWFTFRWLLGWGVVVVVVGNRYVFFSPPLLRITNDLTLSNVTVYKLFFLVCCLRFGVTLAKAHADCCKLRYTKPYQVVGQGNTRCGLLGEIKYKKNKMASKKKS